MRQAWKWLLGACILLILVWSVGIREIADAFSGIRLPMVLVALVVYALSHVIAGLNVWMLTWPLGRTRFSAVMRHYLVSWSLGSLTPGRLGELSLAHFLTKERLTLGEGTFVAMADKMLTIGCIGVFASLGLFVLFDHSLAVRLTLLMAAVAAILLFFVMTAYGRSLVRRYVLRSYQSKFQGFAKSMHRFIRNHYGLLMTNLVLTVVKYLVNAYLLYLLLQGFGARPQFVTVMLLNAVVTIVALIPLSVSGLGLREGSAAYLFSTQGLPAQLTVSAFLLLLLMNYATVAVVLGTWNPLERGTRG